MVQIFVIIIVNQKVDINFTIVEETQTNIFGFWKPVIQLVVYV